MTQYDFVLDISLIGWDPIVSLLMAGIVGLIIVDGTDLFLWGMG